MAEQVLAKVSSEDGQKSFKHKDFLFFILIQEGLTYMTFADKVINTSPTRLRDS